MGPGPARLLTLLLLLALAHAALPQAHAQAQAPDPFEMRVVVDPFPHPTQPLRSSVVTNVTIDMPCAAPTPGGDPMRPSVSLWVEEAPKWSTVVVNPASLAPDPQRCNMGRLVEVAQILVSSSDQAPAFVPSPVKVAATWVGATPNVTGRGGADVSAGYFSILDVVLTQGILEVAPGETAAFSVNVANLGNDDTTVTIEVAEAVDWVEARTPAPFTLQSKQKGGSAIRLEVPLDVVPKGQGIGYENKPGTVTYSVRSHHASDPSVEGDQTRFTVLLTVKGFSAEAPGPGPLPLVAILAVVGVVLGRRIRR